ncbi:TIGR01777 family oxidoreductase [Vibrio sp. WJH972]
MRILITGATGLIGTHLVRLLASEDNQFVIVTRHIENAQDALSMIDGLNAEYLDSLNDLTDLNDIDAVINLAGEPIADRRWTLAQKRRICNSRWEMTQNIVELIAQSKTPPSVFISGSAVGYYGDQGSNIIDEKKGIKRDGFTQYVCKTWEDIAATAASNTTRVCLLRTSVVLANNGGALKKMKLPYQLGLGARIGHGQQYMPWIHIADMVSAINHILHDDSLYGPINLCAPLAAQNYVFSETLAKTLHRPHWLFTPTWFINTLMGESAQLLTDSIRTEPTKLMASSFQFQFPELSQALENLLIENSAKESIQ